MSSFRIPTGGNVSSDEAITQLYFCHQCNRTVNLTLSPSSDLVCPICHGGFLEEEESPIPTRSIEPLFNPFSPFASIFSQFIPSFSTTSDFQNPRSLSSIFGSGFETQNSLHDEEPNVFNPMLFFPNHLQNLRADGVDVQFVIENHPSDHSFQLPANLGDYFMGPGFEQLMQQIAENDPNRYRTPPASKSAVEWPPTLKITDEIMCSDLGQCAVCKDDFELDMEVKQMPCKHMYHPECIMPWLEMHNSCPVCRYELPTDDPDYENRSTASRPNAGNGSSDGIAGGGGGNPQTPRLGERRFSISLPFQFNFLGSDDGDSNSSDQKNQHDRDSGSTT